ncbi:MAG: 50S ribosomal protein L13 [Pseudomonadota bacterium]
MYKQRSFVLKEADHKKKWFLVDATDKTVGRLATKLADILRGKNNPQFTPTMDCGDYVVVINAEKVKFTGKKWDKKIYYWHTPYTGGLKKRTAKEQLQKHPELILMDAVKGMLPKNHLGREQLTKLRIFVGDKHTHDGQKPEVLNIVID